MKLMGVIKMGYHHYDTDVAVECYSRIVEIGDNSKERGHLRAHIIAAFRLLLDRPHLTFGDLIEEGEWLPLDIYFQGSTEFEELALKH